MRLGRPQEKTWLCLFSEFGRSPGCTPAKPKPTYTAHFGLASADRRMDLVLAREQFVWRGVRRHLAAMVRPFGKSWMTFFRLVIPLCPVNQNRRPHAGSCSKQHCLPKRPNGGAITSPVRFP
jgi:hypothetical protein